MSKRTCSPNPASLFNYLRAALGLSLTDVAKATGVNLNVLCQHGLRGVPLSDGSLKRLAPFFQVSMDALVRNDCSVIATLSFPSRKRSNAYRKRLNANRKQTEKIGDMGEDFVADLERDKLKGTAYDGKVNPYPADDQAAVCDILTVDLATNQLLPLEVKSTSGGEDEPVYFSAQELEFLMRSAENGMPYELRRVFYVDKPGKTAQTVYTAQEALDTFDFVPYEFAAYRKKDKRGN